MGPDGFTWEQRAVAGKLTWVLVRPGSDARPQAPLPNMVKNPSTLTAILQQVGLEVVIAWHNLMPARLPAARPLDRDMIEFNESDPHDLWPLIYKRSTPDLSI